MFRCTPLFMFTLFVTCLLLRNVGHCVTCKQYTFMYFLIEHLCKKIARFDETEISAKYQLQPS